jgi:NAD(P)H dehydrogenase (quinone)
MEKNDVNIAVIYYSSTGTIYRIAQEIAETCEKAGAVVRLRKAAELAPRSAIDTKPAWAAHLAESSVQPERRSSRRRSSLWTKHGRSPRNRCGCS